jgi:hypothetical protein
MNVPACESQVIVTLFSFIFRLGAPFTLCLLLFPGMRSTQPIFDVTQFGARGDGLTDDTAAVQAAISAAGRSGRGLVYFPSSSGCYMVSGLTFYSNRSYKGESRNVCIKSILGNLPLVITPAASPFSNVTISNLTFNGNATSFTGHDCLELRGPTKVIVEHVTTTRCGEDGVYVTGWGTGPNPANQGDGLFITNLTSSYNARNGLSVIAGRNIVVRDSMFEHHTISPPFAGVDIEPNTAEQSIESITFENCTFRHNVWNGLTVWEAHADRPNLNLRLINCSFAGNGRDGAYIAGSRHVIRGIYVSGAMTGNKSRDGYRGGLDIWNAGDVVVTNLSVTDASQALVLWGVNGAKVTNSIFSGTSHDLNTSRSSNILVHTSTSLSHRTHVGWFEVGSGVAPRITTNSFATATVGSPYFGSLTAAGDPTITWVQVNGSLPPGLSLSTSGFVAGTPTSDGSYIFTLKACNDITYDERTYTLTVTNPGTSQLHKSPSRKTAPLLRKPPVSATAENVVTDDRRQFAERQRR